MKYCATAISLGLTWATVGRASAQCQPQWSDWFQGNAVDGQVLAMAVYDDDGPGPHPPELYIGGSFGYVNTAGRYEYGSQSNWIAKWNGLDWSPVGDGIGHHSELNLGRGTRAMLVFDPQPGVVPAKLIIAGEFDDSNWATSDRVQSWDGHQWTKLIGVHSSNWQTAQTIGIGRVFCLAVHDADGDGPHPPELYAAGNFDINPSEERWAGRYVARWDGRGWHGLGTSLGGDSSYGVQALISYDDDGPGPHLPTLIAGGPWLYIDGEYEGVCAVRWDGEQWSSMPGLRGNVWKFAVFDEDGEGPRPAALFAFGSFSDIGGQGSGWIARWDGSIWSTVGTPPANWYPEDTCVVTYAPPNSASPGLFLCGDGLGLVEWDGNRWTILAAPNGYGFGGPMAVADINGDGPGSPKIFMQGGIPRNDGLAVGQFSTWDGHAWSGLSTTGLDSLEIDGLHISVDCMAVGPAGHEDAGKEALYVGGNFFKCGERMAHGLAKWDGRSWSPIDNDFGTWPGIAAMTFFEPSNSHPGRLHLARLNYDGSQYSVEIWRFDDDGTRTLVGIAEGTPYCGISGLISFDDDGDGPHPANLILLGWFDSVDGIAAKNIARWDGTQWHDLGGLSGNVQTAAVFDEDGAGPLPPRLFVGGLFYPAEGERNPVSLVRWDGTRFSVVDCPNSPVDHMTTFDEDGAGPLPATLVVSGWSADPAMNGLARWDGVNWAGFNLDPEALSSPVYAIASFDEDGDGPMPPSLVVIANVQLDDGNRTENVAQWRSGQWSSLGSGADAMGFTCLAAVTGPGGATSLYIGGYDLNRAGSFGTTGIARWGQPVPFILKQPSARTAARDSTTLFTIHASGADPLDYQWRRDGRPLTDCPGLTGSTTASLRLEHINQKSVGDYDVVITNSCGSVTSKPAHLSLGPPATSPGTR